ncbi:MAG: pseudouridine synthase [bacterium]|nr:pseudouridine synthase [bacterium]
MERLHKVLSKAGITSRRNAEKLILEGRVKVNNQIITKLGIKVDPCLDEILVENKKISLEKKIYLLLYKPKGYITTLLDKHQRPKVIDLIEGIKERIYPVGRLDFDTSGVLLLTNDGEFSNKLTHPKFKVEKSYLVTFEGYISDQNIKKLRSGVNLEDGLTLPAKIKILQRDKKFTKLLMTLKEGRNRQIKRMGEAINHKVLSLERIAFAGLDLGSLKMGEYRHLTQAEKNRLLGENND